MRLRFPALLFLAFSLAACSTTTVYIVRHAEKVDETDSTDLSPAGKQRAIALADTLAKRGIDSIFTTPYRRTRQTAEPLAQRLSLQLVDYAPKLTSALVDRVNRIRTKTVLVVGHSNTVLDIARGLGASPTLRTIESGDFDNLFVLRIKRGLFGRTIDLSEKTYGQPTQP
ncbi:SixA phosphatase family protein [Spirosoma utsteinense]|uniref:Broad specificity phosphatase PhoE n=1 Tax=Spirosoma utsteinense TaxID=2585773 RepID=A0ABR6W3Z7_9BACT|nr:phosphoglycerate mutase family protein [Spirosoma utsteinense]MBC3784957.1 broad specificity phosphatase PhoE [Spirosoma utsteinense]MBC3790435.1 broad specificity phosphatase PhoE [Spirosoma utsteinense]